MIIDKRNFSDYDMWNKVVSVTEVFYNDQTDHGGVHQTLEGLTFTLTKRTLSSIVYY